MKKPGGVASTCRADCFPTPRRSTPGSVKLRTSLRMPEISSGRMEFSPAFK
jgi:hypothetical protein